MNALSRRGFCRQLHGIIHWYTYDIHAEYSAVRAARKLLATSDVEAFVRAHRSKGFEKHTQEQVAAVQALLARGIDNEKPLPKWRHGKLLAE